MSRHYNVLRQATIGSQFGNIDEALAVLSQQRPQLAQALRRVDWSTVRGQVAREAIEQVAKQRGVTMGAAKAVANWKTDGGAQPHGTCVGVITVDRIDVALFLADDKIELAWAERHYASDERRMTAERAAEHAAVPAAVRDLQRDLAVAYRERALAAALRIAAGGQQVRREQGKDGSVILRVIVKGGA